MPKGSSIDSPRPLKGFRRSGILADSWGASTSVCRRCGQEWGAGASLPIRGVLEMTDIKAHPTTYRLSAYAEGRLDELEMDEIEGHLSSFDSCCRWIRDQPE